MKVGIVGGGVFGCVIGAAMAAKGANVTIYDAGKEMSATRSSGFLMKPSWFSSMKKKDSEASLELLDGLYGLQEIKFRLPAGLSTKAFRVDKDKVVKDSRFKMVGDTVKAVDYHGVEFADGTLGDFDFVVVAAGSWCNNLGMKVEGLIGKAGVSHTWHGQIKESIIKPWAPYKQVVVFNVPGQDRVWGGDGSAIIEKNWNEDREMMCLARVSTAAKLDWREAKSRVGLRPFCNTSDPCFLEKRGKRLWVATGGAKNGTIGAAWAASRLLKEL